MFLMPQRLGGKREYITAWIVVKKKFMEEWIMKLHTVKILKFGTPQTVAIIVLKIEKFDVTLY